MWSDSLDALIAAPRHHTLMLENGRVRVLDTRISPGETTPVHTHCWSSVQLILRWSEFVRRDEEGAVLFDSRGAGSLQGPPTLMWSGPLRPHSLENVGASEIRVISIELKEGHRWLPRGYFDPPTSL